MKVDRRKKYMTVLDTETTNGFIENGKLNLNFSLVYDLGYQITDKMGNVYIKRNFAIKEIILDKKLMSSAYYAEKLPQYWEEIKNGERELVSFFTARKIFFEDCKKYNVDTVAAHNAGFDLRALNNTARLLSGSRCRYFFKRDTVLWDTLKMSNDIFSNLKGYKNFCESNNYMTKHKKPRCRMTAEILYRYLSGDNDFIEAHTGLKDVEIESQILVYCLRSHKKMRKLLFEK